MERGVRRLLLKNVQLEQAGEVSYQALNAVTSAMLNVKGKRSRLRSPHVTSCENKGGRCVCVWGGGAIKMMQHLRSLFEKFFGMSDTETPSSGIVLCCYFCLLGRPPIDLFSGCLLSVAPPVVSF